MMIEPELALLQMQVERRAAYAAELYEPGLRHVSEAFDAVDVAVAARKLIAVTAHPIMLPVAHMHDVFVRLQTIGIDRGCQFAPAANNRLQTGFFAIRDNFGIDLPIALLDAEDDGFTTFTANALTTHAACSEVTFIEFDLARERRLALAVRGDDAPGQSQITVDRIAIQTS